MAESTSQQAAGLTVALETPSARVLADQASVVADLEFVMDCCKGLLAELTKPESTPDQVVPLALWSSALLAYARCFGADEKSGLTIEDVRELPLQGAVENFHDWIMGESGRLIGHTANPFDVAKVGVALTPAGQLNRNITGIAVFSTSRILIDVTGVQQLGALASELARRVAGKAQKQQDVVLADARKQDIDQLYQLPPLLSEPSPGPAAS